MKKQAPNTAQLYFRASELTSTPDKKGLLPISSTTLWRWVKNGDFPPSVKLGPSVTAWSADAIETWLRKTGGTNNV
jgi:predicted DNA-binding transcriptional regulator AlpA